jgi:hypothetical protein
MIEARVYSVVGLSPHWEEQGRPFRFTVLPRVGEYIQRLKTYRVTAILHSFDESKDEEGEINVYCVEISPIRITKDDLIEKLRSTAVEIYEKDLFV